MPIPSYDALMLPVLRLCADKSWRMRDLIGRIADDLRLSAEERAEVLPSGGAMVFANRVQWAKTYLKKAGLIEQPQRSVVQITERGRKLLASKPPRIDNTILNNFPEFRSFQAKTKAAVDQAANLAVSPSTAPTSTPDEQIAMASQILSESLRDALLTQVLDSSAAFFEKLIVDLLLAMGYGGSRTDAGRQLGGTGDGGVDGVISEDQLGLDRIYLQAKRYKPGNTVGSETVQAFIGALVVKGAQKGVLITTSSFSKPALSAAAQSGAQRLVLIDGEELTRLMIRFNVGVRVARMVEIKRVDLDYFEADETE